MRTWMVTTYSQSTLLIVLHGRMILLKKFPEIKNCLNLTQKIGSLKIVLKYLLVSSHVHFIKENRNWICQGFGSIEANNMTLIKTFFVPVITYKRSRSQMFFKIGVLNWYFTGKNLYWRCFPVNVAKFLRTAF